ncbi:phage capsid protein [Bacillus sp. FJAT-18017]|uniref:DUF6366 family protein n=1 Tax=Bacillus sp. FJAT-18017 TaxID=1705566 RepID=UPI0006AF0951|nr:DUF6366 family protein [Bacillus sp. FJAT-18017]ALC90703.1 phage capsid protein [Bacillus sp. FJAT-18017]
MQDNKETPKQIRMRVRQEELKRNPMGNVNDGFNRVNSGSLVDLVGSLGLKATGMLILVIIIGFILASFFFK